jgi:hypothetical protein
VTKPTFGIIYGWPHDVGNVRWERTEFADVLRD